MPSLPALDIAVVRRRWTRFCQSGDPAYLDGLPRALSESWQRSLAQGVDPGLRRFPLPNGQPRWDEDETLLASLAEEAIAPCLAELVDSNMLLTLIGISGRIVYRAGSTQTLRDADSIGSVPGAVTLESAAGTNSAGTTLYRHNATAVIHWQHFCEAFWAWSDVGVPILHPRVHRLLGMVDLALPRGLVSPALALTAKAIAGNFQREIIRRESRLDEKVIDAWGRLAADTAILATDRHGNVLCASDRVKQFLQSRDVTRETLEHVSGLHLALETGVTEARTVDVKIRDRQYKVHVEPAFADREPAGLLLRFERSVPTGVKPWAVRHSFGELIGDSSVFRQALVRAKRLAATDLPILLAGETGTGKELVAHAIHAHSARSAGPFVTLNCGAVPEDLIASELFGYEKGAFTGANRDGQRGKFELAHGGTLFLDEITETSLAFQVSPLRVIQDGSIVPVGADKGRPIDVRIISATNRVPAEAVATGVLRRDLYYRLNGAVLALPPLRARRDDIPALVAHYCREAGRADLEVAPEALARLMAHEWPGNLRELHAVIRTAAALAEGARLEVNDLPAEIGANGEEAGDVSDTSPRLRRVEYAAIEQAMTEARGNVKRAAVLLGIGRSSLYRKLKRMELNREWVWRHPPD